VRSFTALTGAFGHWRQKAPGNALGGLALERAWSRRVPAAYGQQWSINTDTHTNKQRLSYARSALKVSVAPATQGIGG